MSWPTVALREVADIERNSIKPEDIGTGTRYLGLEHVESGGRIISSEIVENGELASSKFSFNPRHILYGKLRPYLAKIALPDFEGVCSTDILPVLPSERIAKNYLAHFLRQSSMVNYANSRSTGANLPRLNPKALAEFPIPLPPLEEQKRIAGILDQADALRRLRTRALDKLNTLGQAIFHEMFGEEASAIIASRAQSIKDFCDVSSGSTPSRTIAEYYAGTIPWVKTGEVNGSTITETEECVSDIGRESARLKVYPAGTVLIAMYGQGKTRGQVGILGVQATTNQACAALIPKKEILSEFLFYQLRSSYNRLRDQGRGGNQPNLNASMVKDFPIFVPDLKEQARFVKRVHSAEKRAEELRACIAKHQALFASLQHRAFRGEL